MQCNMEKGIAIAIKILSSARVDLALEPMNAFIGQSVDKSFIKKLHQQINAGNSPLICACTGVTDAQIADEMNAQFDQQSFHDGKQHVQFDKALDAMQSSLGCGRQCGSCHSEVTQCAQQHWQQALTYIDAEYSTEEDVA